MTRGHSNDFIDSTMTMTALTTTGVLLEEFKHGDRGSAGKIIRLYQPILLHWAHGRVPHKARNYMETEDMVQDTMALALKNNNNLRATTAGEFVCYLRAIFINQLKQELRKNQPFQVALTTQFSNSDKLAYEEDVGLLMSYDAAMDKLGEQEKQAVVMRIEFGMSHKEIATLLKKNTPDAARVYIARAIAKLGKYMSCQSENQNRGA